MIEIEFWYWWVAAAVLGGVDMLAQSGYSLSLGVAALVVGMVLFVVPDLSWQSQLLVFAGFFIVVMMSGRYVSRQAPSGTDP